MPPGITLLLGVSFAITTAHIILDADVLLVHLLALRAMKLVHQLWVMNKHDEFSPLQRPRRKPRFHGLGNEMVHG